MNRVKNRTILESWGDNPHHVRAKNLYTPVDIRVFDRIATRGLPGSSRFKNARSVELKPTRVHA